MIWVINSNSNHCKIYQYNKSLAELTTVSEFVAPENKLKAGDYLTSDKPGHYKTNRTAGGAFSPHTDPQENAIAQFIHSIATEVNKGRKENRFEALIIIAPSKIGGLLNKTFDKNTKSLIINSIQKEVDYMTDAELITFLKKHAHYADAK